MPNLKFIRLALGLALGLAALAPSRGQAQTQNQVPITNYDTTGQSQLLTQSLAVTGGTLYISTAKAPGNPAAGTPPAMSVAQSFVPSSAGGLVRYQSLTGAKSDAGVGLTASATAGAMGVARTAGTNLDLVGEATSSSAKTDKAMWELNVADSYVAGSVIPVTVNANYTGSGTITGASTTLTVAAYTEVAGVETAITGITAAQQFTGTAANYVFNIPTTAALVPGQHIVVEVVMLVTSASGANTGQINSVALTM